MENLITDSRTDSVSFSKLLTQFKLWAPLEKLLHQNHISYSLIPRTKDIWVRDFMPIQITTEKFVTFTYDPIYLHNLPEYHTDWVNWVDRCVISHYLPLANGKYQYTHHSAYKPDIDIRLDGGNVIKCDDCVLITDKVFQENRNLKKSQLIDALQDSFSSEIIIIPSDPSEKTGHADGMVRYIGNNAVLLNHYVDYNQPLRKRLLKALSPRFNVAELHYGTKCCPNTNWAYINYLQIGNLVVAPTVNEHLDSIALPQLEEILKTRIFTLPALGPVRIGGGLNCLSWTTRGLVDNLEYDGERYSI